MKLSDCKTFADIQMFCDRCKEGKVWWTDEDGSISSTDVDAMEFYFDSAQRRLMWRFAIDTVGNELYSDENEAALESVRRSILLQEQTMISISKSLEELREREHDLLKRAKGEQ